VVVVSFQAFAGSSHGRIVETRAMRAELVESAASSGSSRLHSSMNFGSRN